MASNLGFKWICSQFSISKCISAQLHMLPTTRKEQVLLETQVDDKLKLNLLDT